MDRRNRVKVSLYWIFPALIFKSFLAFGYVSSHAEKIDEIFSEITNNEFAEVSEKSYSYENPPCPTLAFFDFTIKGSTVHEPTYEIASLESVLFRRELSDLSFQRDQVQEKGAPIRAPPIETKMPTNKVDKLPTICMAPWVYSSISVRHTEGRGIGYKHGYTSLEAMVFPAPCKTSMWPFIDLRFHVFNNQDIAANAGLGFRYACGKRIFGVNAYFDYRWDRECDFYFTRSGIGLELLGCCYDLRLNGYLPIKQRWLLERCLFTTEEGEFFLTRKRYEAALSGVNFEIGRHFNRCGPFNFYAAISPYYIGGDVCRRAFGGLGRVQVKYCDYLTLEGKLSYDCIFRARGQVIIGLNFPLGCKICCPKQRRLSQRVERYDIIGVDRFCKWKFNYLDK